MLTADFRAVDFNGLGRFNVYLFDGPHERDDQYDGVKLAQPALDEEFVLIVDDWNWPAVRAGTLDAVRDLVHAHDLSYALGIHPLYVDRAGDADIDSGAVEVTEVVRYALASAP